MLCQKCSKEHNGSFGSGKFCSRACANSRFKSEETKLKVSSSIKEGIESGRIIPTSRKGIKMSTPRTDEHTQKIAQGIKQAWDQKGRKTNEQKKAGVKAAVYAYRARKRNAVPANADLSLIKRIYELTPVGYQVDHIVPLAVGGLHHQDNLQYLPISENQSKGKRTDYVSENVIRWQDLI